MKTYLEIKETERLENAATCLRDKLLIRILRRLGCRVSQALALNVKDVDFSRGAVTIEHLKFHIKLICPICGASLVKSHAFCPKVKVVLYLALIMPLYDFRLRFNFPERYRIGSDVEEIELLVSPLGERIRLRSGASGTPIKDHNRAAVLGGPFASEDQARDAAEKSINARFFTGLSSSAWG